MVMWQFDEEEDNDDDDEFGIWNVIYLHVYAILKQNREQPYFGYSLLLSECLT